VRIGSPGHIDPFGPDQAKHPIRPNKRVRRGNHALAGGLGGLSRKEHRMIKQAINMTAVGAAALALRIAGAGRARSEPAARSGGNQSKR
jgi:hypothetical protein